MSDAPPPRANLKKSDNTSTLHPFGAVGLTPMTHPEFSDVNKVIKPSYPSWFCLSRVRNEYLYITSIRCCWTHPFDGKPAGDAVQAEVLRLVPRQVVANVLVHALWQVRVIGLHLHKERVG